MSIEQVTKNLKQDPNPKNIIVRNAAGQARRARKSELKWFAERGWKPEVAQNKEGAAAVR